MPRIGYTVGGRIGDDPRGTLINLGWVRGGPAMFRASWAAIAFLTLALSGSTARAQFNFVGGGSTVGGDMARGAGIFNFGTGLYNYYTAAADSIATDTWMR